ncbi:MAG: hypothetical protein JO089_03745, partial [Alphaproteobacteria bacterium]|nr:hypothetical protein [Alphaproteobacteria bacterium]
HADVANVTYLSIYQVNASNNTFTYLGGGSGPVSQPPAPVNAVAFSPEDIYLAVGVNAGNNLYVYKQSGGVFSTVGVTASATNAVTAVAFSRDNRYLAVGMSGGAKLVVYGVGDTFSSVNIGIVGGLPATAVTGVSFSYDNRYLAVSTNNATQSLYVYRIDPTSTTNTFTLVTGANSSYTGLNAVSASPRQHVITMAGNAAPFAAATKYVPIEDSFTLQGNSATVGFASQPLGAATGVTQRYLH